MLKDDVSVFLTVGNKSQKELCEKIISMTPTLRRIDITVVSDYDCGYRLGSGGAVLNILRHYYKPGMRMLIINSGGMSKRLVNYAVRSKAFADIYYDDEVISLLELILIKSEKILSAVSSGVVVCCSDIVVNTDDVDFCFNDNTCLCIKTDFLIASRHGVVVCDTDNLKMYEYLHKREPEDLKKIAEKLGIDGMLVDTGITYFTDEFSTILSDLAKSEEFNRLVFQKKIEISLYSDVINLLSVNIDKNDYLNRETTDCNHFKAKELLYNELRNFSMNVFEIENEKFLHFGSLSEMLCNIKSFSDDNVGYFNFNSFVDEETVIGDNSLLDGSQLKNCKIGRNCLITDVTLENVFVDNGKSVCGVKLCDGSFVTMLCDIAENPKECIGNESKWDKRRFYKGKTFTESLEKHYAQSDEQKYSMDYCLENADFEYFYVRRQYLAGLDSYTVSETYLKKREDILNSYFTSEKELKEIVCIKNRVEVNLPLRVNFSGTWTDAMPYCVDNGGQVVNMAITLDGELPIKVIVEKLPNKDIEFSSDGHIVRFNNNYENDEDDSDFNLHKAALRTVGINSETIIKNGFRLITKVLDVDKGSGLGTSSILLGGCIKALSEMFGLLMSEGELLNAVFVAEQVMNTGGGWQDQVGGLTPGIKVGSTVAGLEQNLVVDYINLPESFINLFSERLVLLPSGQRHFGRFIVNDVVNRYLSGNKDSIKGHKDIRKLNEKLIISIENEDERNFCSVINEHRRLLKMISPKVTNPVIEDIIEGCMDVAYAVSPCGAGGGGYLLVVLREDITFEQFKEFAKKKFPWIKSSVKKVDIYNQYPDLKMG